MSADDNDPRHLESARGLLATSERMLANNRARNQRLSADNDDLRASIAALTAALAAERAAREKAEECATELRGQYAEKSEVLILAESERDAARLAREKAEKESAQYKLWWDETAKSHDATNAHLEQAEHERDAARAAREKAEWMRDHWCQEYTKSQNELATAVEGLERYKLERDTALARVKELEDKVLSSAPSPAPERSDKRSRWNELGELPVTVMATSEYPSCEPRHITATDCLHPDWCGGVDLCRNCREGTPERCDRGCCGPKLTQKELDAITLPKAPCSGCASLSKAIDQAIRDMLSGGHPFEAGVAKAINDLRSEQKEHGNG